MRCTAWLVVGLTLAAALPAEAAGAEYPGAAWAPACSCNYTTSSRESTYDIRWIIIHTAEGSYGGTISWFQNPNAKASAQFVVAKDGRVAQMVHGKDIAWQAGNWAYNTQSVGLEHEGFAGQAATWTEAMYRASAALTRWLADRYGVPLTHPTGVAPANPASGAGIIGHNQVPDPNNPSVGGGAGRHWDPGPYFDWAHFMALVRGDPVDTAPPVTTASLAGAAGDNGWWRSPVTVSLTATDAGTGVASTSKRVDGGAWGGYGGPFAVAGEGAHQVQYYSVDRAGNAEAARTTGFGIDTVAPATGHALAGPAGDEGWWRGPVTVTLAATDATSGVALTRRTVDGAAATYAGPFVVGGDGAHALGYQSRDRAGNEEPGRSAPVRIDATPPLTALGIAGPTWTDGPQYVSEATVFTLDPRDATSGVRATAWSWRGAEQGYARPFGLGGPDGPGTLAWSSTDRAGNAEAWRTLALALDTTPPVLTIDAPAADSVVLSLDPVAILAEASDAGSGVARVEFLVDGALRASDSAAPYAWAWPAGDEALGTHVLEVRAVDRLGHARAEARNVTTVPTSPAGLQATAAAAQHAAEDPPRMPVLGVVAEADPAGGTYRLGVDVDGTFIGVEG